MSRDHCSEQAARAILQAQMPAAEKAARASQRIDTDCSLEELQRRVETALTAERHKTPVTLG